MNLTQELAAHRLLAIVRASSGEHLIPALHTLIEAGVRAVEVTLPTPGSLQAVSALLAQAGASGINVAIGVGTVTSTDDVRRAADSGAQFVVSPHFDPAIVAVAKLRSLGALPGVFTPTEALRAWHAGASAVKLFPASSLGPGFLAAIRQPLPGLPVVPTGGVGLNDVVPWLDAGALAVAVGSPLMGDALQSGDMVALRRRAESFLAVVGSCTNA
ncbi:2-dehydro-3-deoxyphosphogluconate aldolase/(4S)-4-hydroxy-2-oxoglutarate aldolase [Catenulispora sp. MAP12-49]|uniref:bifunctional 4-hydroxy-2-oxoglutarate aldolase/2-dehydro-3-deoxy-phosphogluconate aldolase n=1 Tax=unclassified Catenulispora TaxID=414885 RepID=UPI00351108A5